jgi:phenylacetate-coenzyme A ligase PaaK-like adenylate-forming protein
MVILPAYSLPALCETIQKYKISFIHIVPPQLIQLAKREEVNNYDLSTLEEVMCGAAPFSYQTVVELQQRLKKKILVKNACESFAFF